MPSKVDTTMKPHTLLVLIIVALTSIEGLAQGTRQQVIVTKDSIALRLTPSTSDLPSKYAMIGLQLQVLEMSSGGGWYKVKIGEQKGYQLTHTENYWVAASDVFQEPTESRVSIVLDVSAFQSGSLSNAHRISHQDYIYKQRKTNLTEPFYVGCTYTNNSPELTCSPPFSICAQIYQPEKYFLYDDRLSETDAVDMAELQNRFSTLFENGTITPFYRVTSQHQIKAITEKVMFSKLVMKDPGCYAEQYSGTEFRTLRSKTDTVNANVYFSAIPIETPELFNTHLQGGVQTVYFLFLLNITFEDDAKESVVRRIVVWWPKCL